MTTPMRYRTRSVHRAPSRPCLSDIQLLRLFGALHDEAEPRRRILAHQLVDHTIGHELILTSTRSKRRVRGLSVVSHSTFGIISPSP